MVWPMFDIGIFIVRRHFKGRVRGATLSRKFVFNILSPSLLVQCLHVRMSSRSHRGISGPSAVQSKSRKLPEARPFNVQPRTVIGYSL